MNTIIYTYMYILTMNQKNYSKEILSKKYPKSTILTRYNQTVAKVKNQQDLTFYTTMFLILIAIIALKVLQINIMSISL